MEFERKVGKHVGDEEVPIYLLEKSRSAPKDTLNDEEKAFLEAHRDNVELILDRINAHPSLARGVLREMLRPDLWRALLNINRADAALNKVSETKDGQLALAREEAEASNEEYDRRALAVRRAVEDFASFIKQMNEPSR